MKRVSILIYSLASGGAERVTSILLEELNILKNRYKITLVLMSDIIFYDIPKDIDIIYLENSKFFESGSKKFLKLPFLAWKYKNFCKKNSIDVSLSFMNRPNYINTISKFFGNKAKIIISERIVSSQEYQSDGIKDKISRSLIKFLYPKADLIIPNSQGIKIDLIKKFEIKTNIKVINNPIDLDKVLKKQNEHIPIKLNKFTFITVGRLFEQKNHKLVLSAIKDVDAFLYIIGDGVLKNKLESLIQKYSLENRVFLLGRQENPYKYLSKADCFLFSSNYEGFPNVLLEALSCSLPVISTDCISGPREILAPDSDVKFQLKNEIEFAKYGILVPVNDVDKLKEAMNLIIADKDLRNRYKEKAQQRARDFDVKKIIKQYEDVINA